jgi:AcrR family transcriptional regulator
MTTSEKRTRGRPRDDTLIERRREEILDSAAPLFAQWGYQQTEMQRVADALQVGKGTIYRYFAGKQELFLAAVDRGMRRLRAHVDASGKGVVDPLDRVRRAIAAYLEFFHEHSEYAELLVQERAVFRDHKKSTYFEHRDADAGPWPGLFRGLIDAGRVRDVPVERIISVLSDLVYGTMFSNYFAGSSKPHQEQARDILDIVLLGLLTEHERRSSSEQ